MTTAPSSVYAIRIDGHLDDHWSRRLGGLTITHNGDGTTTLIGPVTDQAHLHGVLAGVRDIGAILIDLRGIDPSGRTNPSTEPAPSPRPVLTHPRRTQRLTLRSGTIADADATWTFRHHDSVNAWLTGTPTDIEAYRTFFADPARLATTIVILLGHTPAAEVIGELMVRRHDALATHDRVEARGAQAELGWLLDPTHGGRGYATEAVHEILRYCFADLGVHRVIAACFLDDASARRLMERVGMRREAHSVRASLHRSGQWLDTIGYAVLAEDWTGA